MNIIIIPKAIAFCNIFSLCFLIYLYFFEKRLFSERQYVQKCRKAGGIFDTKKRVKKPKKRGCRKSKDFAAAFDLE